MQGAELIANSLYYGKLFYSELEAGICMPIINAIEGDPHHILTARKIHSVGLMATSGT